MRYLSLLTRLLFCALTLALAVVAMAPSARAADAPAASPTAAPAAGLSSES